MKSPWIKAGLQQWKNEKDQISIEREELSTQQSLCQGRKERKLKAFQISVKIEALHHIGHNEGSAKRKAHNSKCHH